MRKMKKLILLIVLWFILCGAIMPISEEDEKVFKTTVAKYVIKVWQPKKDFPDFSLMQEIQEVSLFRVEEVRDIMIFTIDVRFAVIFYDKEGIFDRALMTQRWIIAIKNGQVVDKDCAAMDAMRVQES